MLYSYSPFLQYIIARKIAVPLGVLNFLYKSEVTNNIGIESSHAEMLPRDNSEQLPLVMAMMFRAKSTM